MREGVAPAGLASKSMCCLHEKTIELLDGNITTDDAVRLRGAGVLLQSSFTIFREVWKAHYVGVAPTMSFNVVVYQREKVLAIITWGNAFVLDHGHKYAS